LTATAVRASAAHKAKSPAILNSSTSILRLLSGDGMAHPVDAEPMFDFPHDGVRKPIGRDTSTLQTAGLDQDPARTPDRNPGLQGVPVEPAMGSQDLRLTFRHADTWVEQEC
jgi:hypothetical protein